MKTTINAILIHEDDNVVTVLTDIEQGRKLTFQKGDDLVELNVVEDVPVFHKVALADIEKNTPVLKYGHVIGKAITHIARGSHVHDHNIMSPVSKG